MGYRSTGIPSGNTLSINNANRYPTYNAAGQTSNGELVPSKVVGFKA